MTKRIVADIDEATKNEFKSKASLEGKTITEKLLELIKEYLAHATQN